MNIDKKFVDSLILGSMLGDGSVEKPSGLRINYVLSFTQNSKNNKELNYIKLKFDLISMFYKTNNIREKHNNTLSFSISTKEKILTEKIRNISRYENNSRKIPDIKYIDPVVMLFWYLDDGSLSVGEQKRKYKSTISRRLKITLCSYTDEDILKFIKDFKNKFDIEFKPLKYKGKIKDIGLKKIEEITKFLDLIEPYRYLIPEEQQYKFCMCILDENLNKYNKCNVINTGICTCRNKKLDFLERYNFNDHPLEE